MNTSMSSRRALTVNDFLEAYSVGRTFFYDQVREGRLKTLKVGGKTLIRIEDADAWLNSFDVKFE